MASRARPRSTNESVTAISKKLDAYSALPRGWHFGSGVALKRANKRMAQQLSDFGAIYGLEMDAFPGLDGSCAVAFYKGERKVEVVVNSASSFTVHDESGFGFDFSESEPESVTNIRDIQDRLLNLSERVCQG